MEQNFWLSFSPSCIFVRASTRHIDWKALTGCEKSKASRDALDPVEPALDLRLMLVFVYRLFL
jgi:hypothetical protein